MGRELQKKKNRSSINKVKHRPKSKKIGPKYNPIIEANWVQGLTLSQNYRNLGLLSKVNGQTGGTTSTAAHARSLKNGLEFESKAPTDLIPSEVRIERDPETGAILRVIRPAEKRTNPLNDPLNDLSDEEKEKIAQPEPRGVVRELERQAQMKIETRPRQQSAREEEWIAQLVAKHGDDYGRMARDRKLNPYQQTAADIGRRVKKWVAKEEKVGSA